MSKTWGFGEFWLFSWVFWHCTPTYDTFLESLGHCEYSGRVYTTFGHHQEDQEGQECPKHGVLEDFGCLDGYFVIVPLHMILFWNPWDIVSILEGCTGFLVTIMKIRKVKNVQHMGFWRILSFSPHIHNIFLESKSYNLRGVGVLIFFIKFQLFNVAEHHKPSTGARIRLAY